jgi:hypothetical protein
VTAPTADQLAAREAIADAVIDAMRDLVIAIAVRKELGTHSPALAIKITAGGSGGPEIVIDEAELNGYQLATLHDLIGSNLDLELRDGRIVVFSPSWRPDRMPE